MQQLIAEEGQGYTDGEIYGREICLPESVEACVFRQVDESEMPKENPMKYSTLSIKRELSKLGKWEAAKDLLAAFGYWDDYSLANYLSEKDEVFKTACGAMVARGIVTQAELDALLPKCKWTAD